jgi:hypothetical protein
MYSSRKFSGNANFVSFVDYIPSISSPFSFTLPAVSLLITTTRSSNALGGWFASTLVTCELVKDSVVYLTEVDSVVAILLLLPFDANCCLTKFKCMSTLLILLFFKAKVASSNSTFY